MKHCPQCQRLYDDETVFCVEDGSSLVLQAEADPNRFVVSLGKAESSEEIQTRYVRIPTQQPIPVRVPENQNWLYGVIGGLAAIVIMGGIYLLLMVSGEKDRANARVETPAATANATSNNVSNAPTLESGRNYFPANIATNTPRPAVNVPPTNAMYQNPTSESRFRRMYAGTVDNNGISMDLERNGSSLTGKVRPNGRYADIYVSGNIGDDGSFQMDEKSDIGVVTGIYRGRLNGDGTMTGTWSKPGGDKTRPLFLRRK